MYLIQGQYSEALEWCNQKFDGNCFVFDLLYVDEASRFREIDRFLYESRHTLRFENEYKGNVVIDISEWVGRQNSFFDAFMFFLKDNPGKYNCALICSCKCTEQLVKVIKSFFNIEEVVLQLPTEDRQARIGFTVEDGGSGRNVRG